MLNGISPKDLELGL